ncbi:MAG: ribosome recycling factor [Verrucomicrobiales bacterium]|nr:ribosome recycling factor [Verrucomicrobiales bacterium]
MDEEMTLLEVDEEMGKAVEWMSHEFAAVRTGKASPALVENIDILVQSYGSAMKLKQLALITTPEPRMLMVQPFDPSTTQEIERGLRESKLGINPAVDGKIIRLPVPQLSEERRREMVKLIKQVGEEAKVRVRGVRKDGMDTLKKAEGNKEITEDDLRRLEKEVQNLTDKNVKEIDTHLEKKEVEVMTV